MANPPNFGAYLVPGNYYYINNSQANTAVTPSRVLLVGQQTIAGTATPNVAVISSGAASDGALFGYGSMLHQMSTMFQANNTTTQVWCLPLADSPAGTFGQGNIAVTGNATASGTLCIYVAGNLLQVAVNTNDTPNIIASNINYQITNTPILPITGTVSGGTVAITAKSKGAAASDVDIRLNYAGQSTPAGIQVTTNWTPGTGDPDIALALANLGNAPFDFIVSGYNNVTALTELETFLSDNGGRWDGTTGQLFGHAWTSFRGNYSALVTEGQTNNNQHVTMFGVYDVPNPMYALTAAIVGATAPSIIANPASPVQTVQLNGILAPYIQNQFPWLENQTLLGYGISTLKFDQYGGVFVERVVTTFQTQNGVDNNSYQDVETMYSLAYVIRAILTDLASKFPSAILLPNGSTIPSNVSATTPALIANEVVSVYRGLALLGIVENPDLFAQNIVATNPSRGFVALQLPITLAGQLRVTASYVNFTNG
jgi:phage tail sheath gpL-like